MNARNAFYLSRYAHRLQDGNIPVSLSTGPLSTRPGRCCWGCCREGPAQLANSRGPQSPMHTASPWGQAPPAQPPPPCTRPARWGGGSTMQYNLMLRFYLSRHALHPQDSSTPSPRPRQTDHGTSPYFEERPNGTPPITLDLMTTRNAPRLRQT